VHLDLRHLGAQKIHERLPLIAEAAETFARVDPVKEPIPVCPAVHYTMGGIPCDVNCATPLPGLYAAGECSSVGIHGANRLGSNSLLEGLVFGTRAGARAALEAKAVPIPRVPFDPPAGDFWADDFRGKDHLDLADLRMSLQSEMWRRVGIERTGEELRLTLRQIREWVPYVLGAEFAHPTGWTLQNMMLTGYAIALGALRREESRGVHFRADFPERDDARWGRHQDIRLSDLEETR
jgi:succinate dehydrogenase/fumarate reductase flavoprotein subunit